MPYVKQEWENSSNPLVADPAPGTPITKVKLDHIETGIFDAQNTGDAALAAAGAAQATADAALEAAGEPGAPDGGTTGQALVKASDDDGDVEWATSDLQSVLDGGNTATDKDILLSTDSADHVQVRGLMGISEAFFTSSAYIVDGYRSGDVLAGVSDESTAAALRMRATLDEGNPELPVLALQFENGTALTTLTAEVPDAFEAKTLTLPAADGMLATQEWVVENGGSGGSALEVRSDTTPTYSYMGTAPAGTSEGDSEWTVTRITLSSPPVVETASGVWDDRASLDYA